MGIDGLPRQFDKTRLPDTRTARHDGSEPAEFLGRIGDAWHRLWGAGRNGLQHDAQGGTDIRQIGPCLQADGHQQFIAIIGMGISAVVLLILAEPYRIRRVTSFWNPWEDPFGSGYQLTQSLMAFGRGELWGQGLGNSVQKLEYLPEAHTDFIFSIIAEELGYIGVVLALLMVFFVAFRAMSIGRKALEIDHRFSGFLACSIGIWFSFQALVNVGAAAGMLPTKGLTLPLISYGGSSLLIMSTAIMMLLRIDYETRLEKAQAFTRGSR